MANNLSMQNAAAILKEWYMKGLPVDMTFQDRPALGLIQRELTGGRYIKVPSLYAGPGGTSSDFAVAAANASPSQFGQFQIPTVSKYTVARIDGQVIAATASDRGAFVKEAQCEIDKAMRAHANQLHSELFGDSTGVLAQVASVSGAVVTLSVATDVLRFEAGYSINFSTSRTSGLNSTAYTVIKRDTGAGTLTLSTAPGAVSGQYISRTGDFGACMQGFKGWIPFIAPVVGDNFYGQDRSVDVERLAGSRLDGTGGNIQEVLIELEARISEQGGRANVALMNPRKVAELKKQLSGQTRFDGSEIASIEQGISYKALVLPTNGGDIQIIADRKQDLNLVHMLQLDTWSLCSMREIGHLADDDGLNGVLRITGQDAIEARVRSYLNLKCTAPAYNGVAKLG